MMSQLKDCIISSTTSTDSSSASSNNISRTLINKSMINQDIQLPDFFSINHHFNASPSSMENSKSNSSKYLSTNDVLSYNGAIDGDTDCDIIQNDLSINSNTQQQLHHISTSTSSFYPPQKDEDAIKLFIGQVPRTMEEDELLPILEQCGDIYDLIVIRDKMTGAHRGCAFVTYCKRSSADEAVERFHNKLTLPPSTNPLQVRPAEGQAGVPVSQEHKLFIGMIPRTSNEDDIRNIFQSYGDIEEIYILKHPTTGQSKGCAFLKYKEREAALNAIENVNGNVIMENGTSPLVVKFADSRRQRLQRARAAASTAAVNSSFWQLPPGAALPFPQLQQVQPQYMQHMQSINSINSPGNIHISPHNPNNGLTSFMYYNPYAFGGNANNNNNSVNHAEPYNQTTSISTNQENPSIISTLSSQKLDRTIPVQINSNSIMPTLRHIDVGTSNTLSTKQPSRSTSQMEGPPGANLFIYHLPHDLTDADLATAFAPFGTVISAKVYMDKNTGESKGFGFVSYDSVDSADSAINAMNGFQIGSKRLKVQHKRVHGNNEEFCFDGDSNDDNTELNDISKRDTDENIIKEENELNSLTRAFHGIDFEK